MTYFVSFSSRNFNRSPHLRIYRDLLSINKRSPERSDVPCFLFFKNSQPILESKGLLIKVETRKALRAVTYVVSFPASSRLVSSKAAFRRLDRSVNGGLVNVVINESGRGQRMSQEASEGKVGGLHSR